MPRNLLILGGYRTDKINLIVQTRSKNLCNFLGSKRDNQERTSAGDSGKDSSEFREGHTERKRPILWFEPPLMVVLFRLFLLSRQTRHAQLSSQRIRN